MREEFEKLAAAGKIEGRHIEPLMLLVESGSRAIAEKVLALFYERHSAETVDLLTCRDGVPDAFRTEQGQALRSFDYADRASRRV